MMMVMRHSKKALPSSETAPRSEQASTSADVPDWKEYVERTLEHRSKLACLGCRKRKQRCDRVRPKCRECALFGRKCEFDKDPTGTVALANRVKDLEAQLQQRKLSARVKANARLAPAPRPSILVDDLDCDISAMRIFFLKHRARLGVCFTEKRFMAIRNGDTNTIHPALVYAGQLAGCMFHFNERERFHPHPAESLQLRRTMETLNEALESNDLDILTALQVTQLVSKYLFYRDYYFDGRDHVLKAAHLVMKNDLHIGPVLRDDVVLPSDGTFSLRAEEIGILCQLLYLDMTQRLMRGGVLFFPDYLYDELSDIYDSYDFLCTDVYLFAARASCMSYFVATHDLEENWSNETCCPADTEKWYISYSQLLGKTRRELAYLQARMREIQEKNDADTARGLLTAVLLAFAALIKLYSLTAPTLPESRELLLKTVIQVAQITQSLKDDDLSKMCPTTVYAWIHCVRALQKEVAAADTPLSADKLNAMLGLIKQRAIVLDRKMPSFRVLVLLASLSGDVSIQTKS
ncbi:hypothetical protein CYLTODRAFT_494950 [Cylindrobasidium torrendii FP15055 ss-10]|uniref:Zn(2)-C6 fungal-type domain-containing protein n=1 Tax=Cylindrobasidium torrendii FP15055 ss-10 TaxID=1314674 RepID=A0A0D7AVD4_9AGAR|nr:hypothetical protein CYLTODRAFT_494950 [Cylindrobasidium torrendii FP15055 ss-10]